MSFHCFQKRARCWHDDSFGLAFMALPQILRFRSARSFTLLSIAAAVVTTLLKLAAWRATGSVGLLSDALESLVNLAAALMAFWALGLARKAPDRHHPFGHSKAEYFSSGLESALIIIAALGIVQLAVPRLLHPEPPEALGFGLGLTLAATAVNGAVAMILLRAGGRLNSIGLRADGHHLLTDVWTSLGVIVGLAIVRLTGLAILDPVIAIAVALNIIFTGWRLLRETASGLLDHALPAAELERLEAVLAAHRRKEVDFHAIRTRRAGARRFVSLHVLVPGSWSVADGHAFCDQLEHEVIATLPDTHVITHLEPIEEPGSWDDEHLAWERNSGRQRR
jgi:cation diffusion facilitator family transporter